MSYSNGSKPPSNVVPECYGYQLIGDNQFLRFSEALLNIKCTKRDGLKYSGLCVRGQKIIDLLRRIHTGFADVSEKVVLLIGTTDLLHGTSIQAMCEDFKELLKLLSKNAKKIILLTVPPVLKLTNNEDHWNRLRKFNEFIRQCRDDEKIFVGDAYEQFIVPKESLERKSRPSNSIFSHCTSSPKSTPIQFSKCLTSCITNKDKISGRVVSSSSPDDADKLPSPSKRFCCALQQSPHDPGTTVQKTACRRQFNFDQKSNREDCQPPAKQSYSLPAKRKIYQWTSNSLYSLSSISYRGILTFPTPFKGTGDSFTSSKTAPASEKKCTSYFFSSKSSSDNNSFPTPSGRVLTVERNNSYLFPPKLPPGGDNSFSTPQRRVLTPKEKFNSPFLSTSSGGDDSFKTGSKRTVLTPKEQFNSSFFPSTPGGDKAGSSGLANSGRSLLSARSSSGPYLFKTPTRTLTPNQRDHSYCNRRSLFCGRDNSSTPLRSFAPERNYISSFFPSTPSSDDNDSTTSSKEGFTLEKKCNSYSRADENLSHDKRGVKDEADNNTDKIRDECFEQYFAGDCTRPDLVHLNVRGLSALRGIILGIIEVIEEKND